jgi:hypothetical protein
VNIDFFGTPTLVGLVVKLDRPMDREHPCCRPDLLQRPDRLAKVLASPGRGSP